MTTETQIMLYRHEKDHPVATSSLAYQELSKRANELERQLAEQSRLVAEMESGFIIQATNYQH